VSRELVDEGDYRGWIEASQVVDLRARVRGHIDKIHFRDGDLVEEGQLLIELDPRPFQSQIDRTTAHRNALDAQRVAAEKNFARYEKLLAANATSVEDFEEARAKAESYVAEIEARDQEIRQHELELEFSRITAPISGRIGRAMLTEGNLVNAGGSDPLLTTIVALDPAYVYFSIDERALQRYLRTKPKPTASQATPLREQQRPFRFGLDSDVGYPHQGILDFSDNRIDQQTGTVQVRGVVQNTAGLFVPGSRVRVRVPSSEAYTAVLVPDTAILSDQDKRYVLVVDDKNVVSRRDVTPGRLLDDGMRVVLPALNESTGLTTDDRIIVLGLQRARVNYAVEPVEQSVTSEKALANAG
jgi:multidrug efflux system membrane fusion protein